MTFADQFGLLRVDPLEVAHPDKDQLIDACSAAGWTCVELDISGCGSTFDFFTQLRKVLWFPDWCGSGWDSMDDAYGELRNGWTFPLLLVVSGRERMIKKNIHDVMQIVFMMDDNASAYSRDGAHFEVVYSKTTGTATTDALLNELGQ